MKGFNPNKVMTKNVTPILVIFSGEFTVLPEVKLVKLLSVRRSVVLTATV